jgi:CubicO group peptidase (beta-lactamase class C family)
LRDQGKMRLDDPVSELLPWFDLEQSFSDSPPITLRSLLTHSSGLPREAETPYWVGPEFEFPTRDKIRKLLGGQSTLYPADRYFQYSNLGLSLVGEIVAEKSNQSFNDYIQEHILTPLKLNDTDVGFPTDDRQRRIATGYGFSGRDGEFPVMPRYDAKGITPAAGFASTAIDLARFASWQFSLLSGSSNKVLKANTLREMQRIQWMDFDWSTARGLGFGIYREEDRTLVGHGGDCPGFNTRLFLDPVSEIGVVTMANRNYTNVYGYGTVLYDILEAGGTPPYTQEARLNEFLGSYDGRPWGGEELVFLWDGGLAMVSLPTMDPIGNMVSLKHIEGDRFHTIRKDDTRGHEVHFERDQSGQVTRVAYHGIWLPKM